MPDAGGRGGHNRPLPEDAAAGGVTGIQPVARSYAAKAQNTNAA